MTTAISKTTSHPPKMKRPPPQFVQPGVNGIRSQPPSSSPPTTSKRLPGAGQSATATSTSHPILNGVNGVGNSSNTPIKGPLGRPRKDAQKPGDQGSKVQRSISKPSLSDQDRRAAKAFPQPYVQTTPYILKKYSKSPPSLTIHLHPTHFRFDQQDGSFSYNSEMKVIIQHIRAGTVPHDILENLLLSGVRFYEGCLIVRVVDHKSVSAQTRKSTAPSSSDNNTPFSIHNYNEHITPSPYVPYPKQNQLASEKASSKETTADQSDTKDGVEQAQETTEEAGSTSQQQKQATSKPRVYTTVLHPTPRSLQAELTMLATTPDPRAAKQVVPSPTAVPPSPGASSSAQNPARGHVAKRQKMLVEPQELLECESKLTRALAPPLFLDPVTSLDGAQNLLKYLESPLHRDAPPSPKRRKRTIAELAADEALAAEEERFMLIMDERVPTSGAAGGPKSAAVDDTGGAVPFEPRFSRFKTLENIRMQHEEKAKREHEMKVKQEQIKRQQQEQERERRRITEQRQAEEQVKEDNRRQQIAAQQAQAQLAAQQQQQSRHVMAAQPNGVVSQAPQQSSPVVRQQTPLNTSSPLVSSAMMATQASVPMAMTSSMQGAGSPPRPPSALQHAHPNMMSHPMVPSRSQQGQSRHGTPQMTQGTPAMSQATPIMRNATPTQRITHASPPRSSMAPTPVMNPAMMGTPQMAGNISLTPQQQQQFLLQRQQLLAQQGQHLNHSQLTPQQFAQLQANMHAQQNIQNHQQQVMQQQQQQQPQPPNPQSQQQKFPNPQAYQAQLMRAQLAQMQMAQHQQRQQQQQPQPQAQQQPQPQQAQMLQNSPQMNAQQQQMLMAAAQANGGQIPQNMQSMQNMQNMQPRVNATQRYTHLYQQRLLRLRQDMATRLMPQYGPPTQYPPQVAQEYSVGLEQAAKGFVQDIMRRDRAEMAAVQQRQAQAAAHAQAVQQQQHNMMQNGMGK